ncbi:ribbon-helix-helix protein, CopG family [Halomicrococcus sp. NG-SE-24]|uniref:ribbon-helix-helix protein, CopG family n=1 Tax=Halomicrococcus sp. NG-SE-24 TaxID=3436928 RepID=UPI003D98689C
MKRVTFKIPEDWKRELDERADEAGDSRSEVLRKIVDDALHTPEDDGEQERLRREVEGL